MQPVTTETSVSKWGWGQGHSWTLRITLGPLLRTPGGDMRGRRQFRNGGRLLREVTLDPGLFILLAGTIAFNPSQDRSLSRLLWVSSLTCPAARMDLAPFYHFSYIHLSWGQQGLGPDRVHLGESKPIDIYSVPGCAHWALGLGNSE